MKVGENKVVASIDEGQYKSKNGIRFKRKEEVKLINQKGENSEFIVKRILGSDYIVLVEKNKKPRLSMLERFQLVIKSVQNSF
jgi:hypothetical protein